MVTYIYNNRGFLEITFNNTHLSLSGLRTWANNPPDSNRHDVSKPREYLLKLNIPPYPRPELHVTRLSHCTDLQGLQGIKRDGGFKDAKLESKVVWWNLTVTPEDLRDANTRTMTVVQPDGTEEEFEPGAQAETQGSFLQEFAMSPAFCSSSRMGSYRFTFDLQDVMEKYSQQVCGGQKPMMRVWKTVLHKQEVVYAVLVHSPTNQEGFSEFPLLQDKPDSICAFKEEPSPHFIWRPRAMSETHSFELSVNGTNAQAVPVSQRHEFYVWDNVALALHVDDKVLTFKDMELRQNLFFCEMAYPHIIPKYNFQSYDAAQSQVQRLWPEHKEPLEKFSASRFHISR